MAGRTKQKVDVTVAIPTFNGDEYLGELLNAVYNQKTQLSYEVLIIDSGSTDNTLSIIKKFKKVRLHEIPNSEFGHGKTRNLAAQMARGEYIVFLSHDAVPAHEGWLEAMIEPFYLTKDVFCVLGKQTPRPHADATTKREVSLVFDSLGPDHSIMLHRGHSLVSGKDIERKLTFFSDVNSAVRLSYLLHKIPYQDVSYAEDQLLGVDVLNSKFLKAYAPDGNVMHSNEYPVSKYYNRRVDEFNALQTFLNITPETRPLRLIKATIANSIRDMQFTLKDPDYTLPEKLRNFAEIPIRNIHKQRASYVVGKKKHTDADSLEAIEKKKGQG